MPRPPSWARAGSAPMALVHEELVVGTAGRRGARPTRRWSRWPATSPAGSAGSGSSRRTARWSWTCAGRQISHGRACCTGCALLGVPWGSPIEGRGAAGTFRETWQLRWEPELAVRLVERSALRHDGRSGGRRLRRSTAARRAVGLAELTRLVEGCLLADLPAGPRRRHATCWPSRAAVHADVPQLMDALGPLARARRYGDVRGTDVAALDAVLRGMVVRVARRPAARLHRARRR